MKISHVLFFLLIPLLTGCGAGEAPVGTGIETEPDTEPTLLATDQWSYFEVDSNKTMWGEYDDPDWLRYFGLATGDINGDGNRDLITGRNVYLNPGGDLSGDWRKMDLGLNVDANLTITPGDGAPTLILGEALPDVYEFRWEEEEWKKRIVAQVPPTGHHNGQGYRTGQLKAGGEEEVILASQGGLYVLEVTNGEEWPVSLVGKDASDEGFGLADMDGDGDLDLVSGYRVPGADAEVPTTVVWFENPGDIRPDWTRHDVGSTEFATDRVEAGDLNGDGRADVVVAEERYPGLEPDASLYVYLQAEDGSFTRQTVVTQFSMNNLDIADFDGDGDLDIVTSEHKGEALSLQLWLNDGNAAFTRQEIDRGKESHLGAQAVDMDGDGDLDLVSIGWDQHQYVHLWRNDAVK